ncbi:MAG: FtsX-like permease family protein, partial [Acidobacteriota bacterium]
ERQSDIAIRLALGANRMQVVRRSFYENILLSIMGGFLGLLFSILALKPLVALSPLVASSPSGNRILNSVTFDSRIVFFTLIVSIAIGVGLTALPLFRSSPPDLFDLLKSAGRRASGSFRNRRIQRVFVVAQLAISFLLLIAAALMMQSFQRLKSMDPGFKTVSLITARLTLPSTRYETHEKRSLFQQQIVQTIESIPGVQAVSTTTRLPLNEFAMTTLFEVDGIPPPEGGFVANFRRIGASYFETLNTRVLEGREFGPDDTEKGMPVAIVSLQMAKRFWPGKSAVGKRIRRLSRSDADWRTVVGVVADLKDSSLTAEPGITLYTPYNQGSIPGFHLVIRASENPNLIFAVVRERIRQLDAALPLYKIATAEELMMDSLSRPRFAAVLLALFALLGIFVAVIGVYGVVSYSTTSRFNEIGLRIAIGARKRSILQMILE